MPVVSARSVHPVGGGDEAQMLRRNFRGRDKKAGSANKYTQFGQLNIRKITKIIGYQMSHVKAKMHPI